MAAPTPIDQTLYQIANARRPCYLRRMIVESGTDPGPSAMFPLDAQYRDTPAGITPRRTTDSEW